MLVGFSGVTTVGDRSQFVWQKLYVWFELATGYIKHELGNIK